MLSRHLLRADVAGPLLPWQRRADAIAAPVAVEDAPWWRDVAQRLGYVEALRQVEHALSVAERMALEAPTLATRDGWVRASDVLRRHALEVVSESVA